MRSMLIRISNFLHIPCPSTADIINHSMG